MDIKKFFSTNLPTHEIVYSCQSTKIDVNKNKWIHSTMVWLALLAQASSADAAILVGGCPIQFWKKPI